MRIKFNLSATFFLMIVPNLCVLETIQWIYDSNNHLHWAFDCDFNENNLKNIQIQGEDCGPACASTPLCTHFTWSDYNSGTCWMKQGKVSKDNVVLKPNSGLVCGVMVKKDDNTTSSGMFWGVNYDAMHNNEYPLHGGSVNTEALRQAIDRDFSQISKYFNHVRTFYSSFYNIPVTPSAAKHGVKLYLGVYMTNENWYKDQVDAAVEAVRKYPGTVSAVLVGNENLRPNGPYSAEDIISRVNNIRSRIKTETGMNIAVGTVQRINEWLNQDITSDTFRLASACDIIGVNIYPFFGNYDYSNPIRPLDEQWNAMISRYGSEKIRLTETGFPTSGGYSPSGVQANLQTAINYFREVTQWKPRGKGPAFWFAFHDRRADDNSVPGEYEKHFGLVNSDGSIKTNGFPPLLN
ncbi:unnamed protein product [Brachionus calyciflorus]|uniref:glucan endo-1,3-beta-D-glucosidase n=1 Tax=Brachionus calyciflorus TaxID=104777 RepID=A0A813UK86_9BILA|nr:unnamed protein product [Brachionus calyciflorus]